MLPRIREQKKIEIRYVKQTKVLTLNVLFEVKTGKLKKVLKVLTLNGWEPAV